MGPFYLNVHGAQRDPFFQRFPIFADVFEAKFAWVKSLPRHNHAYELSYLAAICKLPGERGNYEKT